MLTIGKFAKYIKTGTTGKVMDFEEFNGKNWVLLNNGLFYDTNYLEPISEKEYLENQRKNETKTDVDQLKKWMKRVDEEEIDFEGDTCGAG